jgi:KaiC/GvpD/RAD55 family RecA-like ATPase
MASIMNNISKNLITNILRQTQSFGYQIAQYQQRARSTIIDAGMSSRNKPQSQITTSCEGTSQAISLPN